MANIRIAGLPAGTNLGTVTATVGTHSGSALVPSYRLPSAVPGLPRISDGFDADTLTLDTTGLTGITTYSWRVVGGAVLSPGNAATQTASGLGGQWIECEVTCDQGTLVSPPIMVYSSTHMGMPMTGGHILDDRSVVALVPHAQVTHIAVADGNWTNPATWRGGNVPRNGAFVLVPHQRNVIYDNEEPNIRLDRVRVDGTLRVDAANLTNQQIKMLVETMVVTRGGTFTAGTAGNRIPAAASVEIMISGKDYSAASFVPTDMKASNFVDVRGLGRGVLVQGTIRLWGAEKLTWAKANPINQNATSLTLHKAPTGWAAGDWIVIGGTDCAYDGSQPRRPVWQDEERQITLIDGNTIHWSEPLLHPHKNQLVGSPRTDLYPVVMAKGNKNITFRSEVTEPVHRRGHFATIHHHSVTDLWDAQFIDMGRTDKTRHAGIVDNNNKFRVRIKKSISGLAQINDLAPVSNLQARYPVHLHHVGFGHMGARPVVHSCYVEGTPGWAFVHHGCDADFEKCAAYKFFGAGMVGEQGNELGNWFECLSMGATVQVYDQTFMNGGETLTMAPKFSDPDAKHGDPFHLGYGFAFRGRAVKTSGCVANSCTWGHVFFHRVGGDAENTVGILNPSRKYTNLKEAGGLQMRTDQQLGVWSHVHHPIQNFADNEAIATFGGFFVSKDGPTQHNDVNIKLRRFRSWGYLVTGAEVEYIGAYVLDQFDCVAGQIGRGGSVGIQIGANSMQVAVVNPRVEGSKIGVSCDTNATNAVTSQGDPRWMVVGGDFVNISQDEVYVAAYKAGSPNADALYVDPDWDGTAINFDLDPQETWPPVMIQFNASGYTFQADNTHGNKIDNLSASGKLLPKPWEGAEYILAGFGSSAYYWSQALGKYKYDVNNNDIIVWRDIVSDRLTARPIKVTKIAEDTSNAYFHPAAQNKGTFTYAPNPVTAEDFTVVIQESTPTVINVLTNANPAGGDGVTYTLDIGDNLACDHGIATLNETTGEVTYTPFPGFTGTDEMYVFIKSGERYATVRITFLVTANGVDGGITTPVAKTHFAAFGKTGQIVVTLNTPPDVSNRRITTVQYSTDAGLTWRRLCHGWPQASHTITTESNGTAITTGSYTVRIRYKTDYDFVTSAASTAESVIVT